MYDTCSLELEVRISSQGASPHRMRTFCTCASQPFRAPRAPKFLSRGYSGSTLSANAIYAPPVSWNTTPLMDSFSILSSSGAGRRKYIPFHTLYLYNNNNSNTTMGNAPSQEEVFATAAMAKYMSWTKVQLMEVRGICQSFAVQNNNTTNKATTTTTINRKQFLYALHRVGVIETPDIDVLSNLFTLFDEKGHNRNNLRQFLTGISPLACRGNKLDQVLLFALKVYDFEGTGKIGHQGLVQVLKSLSFTAQLFDDHVPTETQIYKLVDSTFGTLVGIMTPDIPPMLHEDCVEALLDEPTIVLSLLKDSSKVRFKQHNDSQYHTTSTSTPFLKTRLEDDSTIISSVFLTPLQRRETNQEDEQDKFLFKFGKTPPPATTTTNEEIEVVSTSTTSRNQEEPSTNTSPPESFSSRSLSPPLKPDHKVTIVSSMTNESSTSQSKSLLPLTRIRVLTNNWTTESSRNTNIVAV